MCRELCPANNKLNVHLLYTAEGDVWVWRMTFSKQLISRHPPPDGMLDLRRVPPPQQFVKFPSPW